MKFDERRNVDPVALLYKGIYLIFKIAVFHHVKDELLIFCHLEFRVSVYF